MEIKITDKDMEFLRMAAEKSERSVENGGGPFGAIKAFRMWSDKTDKIEY